MRLTRRTFLLISAGAAAGLTARPTLAGARWRRAETYFDWRKARESVRVAFGEGGNALVLLGDGAALLVDTKNAPFGGALRREAEALGAPLTLVVNTHHHADHTAGNYAFTPDLKVMAHPKAVERIPGNMDRYRGMVRGGPGQLSRSDNPAAEAVLQDALALAEEAESLDARAFTPTQGATLDTPIDVGGHKVVLRHFGPGHTDNDLVVHLPEANVVHTGDLVFRRLHPFIDRPGGATIEGWIRSLEEVERMCDPETVVVPGHGELTDREGVREQVRYFETLRERMKAAIDQGQTREQSLNIDLGEFEAYGFEQVRPRALAAAYEEYSEGR